MRRARFCRLFGMRMRLHMNTQLLMGRYDVIRYPLLDGWTTLSLCRRHLVGRSNAGPPSTYGRKEKKKLTLRPLRWKIYELGRGGTNILNAALIQQKIKAVLLDAKWQFDLQKSKILFLICRNKGWKGGQEGRKSWGDFRRKEDLTHADAEGINYPLLFRKNCQNMILRTWSGDNVLDRRWYFLQLIYV
jgi:hypothetical protein